MEYEERKQDIETVMPVEVVWECQVEREQSRNAIMRQFFKDCADTGPLQPRDAYFGGRTGPYSLKCDLEEQGRTATHQILNLDIVSLYPYINYVTEYPVGHGELQNFNTKVVWARPEHNPYRGIIKCFIVPPTDLKLAVVPRTYDGKLMFPLCHECANESDRRSVRTKKPARKYAKEVLCPHNEDSRRGFVTTLTHLELNLALSKGYKVKHLYSAITWKEWSADLFKGYIRDFMKLKVEASGWPEEVGEDPIKRQAYVQAYKDMFEIEINPDAIENNPGLKYIAKM
jgi:hypothetical protein